MKLSERMYKAKPTKSHDAGDVFFNYEVEGWAEEVKQLEAEIAALKRELTEWRKHHREATELAEAVSMSGNMRISVSDRAKMRAMDARLNALLTAEEQER